MERAIQGKSAGLRTQTIVSKYGFPGAGLIIIRRGAGAGLLLLAVSVTVLHFVVVLGLGPLARRLTSRLSGTAGR